MAFFPNMTYILKKLFVGDYGNAGKLVVGDGTTIDIPTGGAGDVVGPASATDGNLAVFDTTTGKLLKDGGAIPSVAGLLDETAHDNLDHEGLTGIHAAGSDNQDLSGLVTKATYDAQTILHATADDTPIALTVGEQTLVGRVTGGNIAAIVIDSDLTSVSANNDTIPSAKATKAMGDLKELKATIQDLGTKNTDYTADPNLGTIIKVTTGSGVATVTIPDWASSTYGQKVYLFIQQGATARVQTLGAASGTNNNIVSSGGLMSAGDALPHSGNNALDVFELTWYGTKYAVTNALFDVKA